MKKYISIILSMLFIFSLVGCGKKEKYEIEILVPAGSTEAFVYSDAEIRPIGNKIRIWSGAGLGDTEVILQPVNENVETGYVAEYLTHGVPVEFDTINCKEEWFKIGVSVHNDSNRGPIAVSVEVEGVEVRIAGTSSSAQDVTEKDLMLLSDSFWESVTKIVFYDIGEKNYESFSTEELEEIKDIFVEISYEEIENPELEGLYEFELQTKDNCYYLGITGQTINFNGKFYKVSDSIANEVVSILKTEGEDAEETIIYNGKEYLKSELCDATLCWLELSEQERMLSSYMPPEFMIFDETWGITLTAENITSTSAALKCVQSGGEPTGELHTSSWFILENWTQKDGWKEMPYIIDREIGWEDIAWIIPMEGAVEWEINWEYLYGTIPAGKYRIGKEIIDFRGPGDFDEAIYFAEFEITE